VFLLMLSCMAFRQQTGIPRLAGRDVGSRSIRSTQIEPTEQSPTATNTRVDSSEISDRDPNTVGAERHAVHIGLLGVRLRRVRGRVPQAVWLRPWHDLPDGSFTKDGNSPCFRYLIVEPRSGTTS